MALHSYISHFIGKNNSRYDDDLINDKIEFEDELENQDKNNTDFLNTENNKQGLIPNDNGLDSLINIVVGNLENNHSMKTFGLNNENMRQSIEIIRYCDIINTIYLEIELDENMTFNDLTNSDKIKLFETKFELTIGGCSVLKTTILANLFMLFSQDMNIKLEENKFQIPLVDFNITKINNYNGIKGINLREQDYGLPQIALQYHELRMIIEFQSKKLFKYMKFNLLVCGRNLDTQPRRILAQKHHEYIFMMSLIEKFDDLDKLSLSYNLNAKIIIIYFTPLNDDYNEYIDYPKIESIEIHKDNVIYLCEYDELLFMELYDICYTVIPLTEDFSSWKNIIKTLKNPQKYMTSQIISYSDKFKLYINYESKPENFELNVNIIIPNIYRIMSGMGGYAFAN